eukprot:12322357-Alexandrium_andersonii.AAC.1
MREASQKGPPGDWVICASMVMRGLLHAAQGCSGCEGLGSPDSADNAPQQRVGCQPGWPASGEDGTRAAPAALEAERSFVGANG